MALLPIDWSDLVIVLVTRLVLNLLVYGRLGWHVLLIVQLGTIDGFHAHIPHDLLALAIAGVGEDVFQTVLSFAVHSHFADYRPWSLLPLISEEIRIVLISLLTRQALAVHLVLFSLAISLLYGLL